MFDLNVEPEHESESDADIVEDKMEVSNCIDLSRKEVEAFDFYQNLFDKDHLSEDGEEFEATEPNKDSLSLIKLNYSRDGDDEEEDILQSESIFDKTSESFPMDLYEDTAEYFSTDTIFANRMEMIEWCRTVGKNIGVVVVTEHSDYAESGRTPRVILSCERSGKYRCRSKNKSSTEHPRKTGTKKCSCPFRLRGVFSKESGNWRVSVDCGLHNHSIGDNLVGHAYVARLTSEEQELVTNLTLAGVKPREILVILKKNNPTNLSTRFTIYNFRRKYKLLSQEGRSQMQQLFKELNENGYVEFHREDTKTGECLDIFLAHPQSIMLAKCFPEVIVMDCTYKTNIHKLPLLEIVGFTSTQKTFSIAFVYLESEKEDNYLWALQKLHQVLESKASSVGVVVTDCELALMNAIPKVFPRATNLLCRWHIMTNIQAKYKKTFKTNEGWEDFLLMVRDLMHSRNMVDYNNNLGRLKREYEHHHGIIPYIEKQWISRYKEKFISVWTDSILHFGTLTTNRAESMHAALKKYLGSSRGNLTRNWRLMNNFLGNQLTAIADSFNKCRNSVRHCYKGKEYDEVNGLVSVAALELLAKELKRSRTIGTNKILCGCVVKRTCGIPCAHELNEYVILQEKCIPLSKIHPRWQKLDIVPVENPRGPLDITPHLENIKKKFISEPDYQKVLLMKKCGEMADPKTTLLQEPRTKANGRGRPKKSKNCSSPKKTKYDTRRNLSAFEYSQTEEEKQANQTSKKNQPLKATDQKSKRARKKCNDQNMLKGCDVDCPPKWEHTILNKLNPLIQEYITKWEDVPGDGHCGYRSVAKLFGYDDREGWKIVRHLLLQEMMSHYHEYSLMFTSERFQQLKNNLECRAVETYNENNWFTIPDMGWLVASAFESVFVCIEEGEGWGSISFFPLRTPPKTAEIKIAAIAHIGKHFVPIVLANTAPIPPLMPGWDNCRRLAAAPWKPLLQSKLDNWFRNTLSRNIMARDVPTKVVNVEYSVQKEEMVQTQNQEWAKGWIKPQNQASQGFYGIGQILINQTPNLSFWGATSNQPVQASTRVVGQPLQNHYQRSTWQPFKPYIDLSCSTTSCEPMLSYNYPGLQSTNIIPRIDLSESQQGNSARFDKTVNLLNENVNIALSQDSYSR